MDPKIDSRGRWFAERAQGILASVWDGDYEKIVNEIDSLEQAAEADDDLATERNEYRRQIAELRLFAGHKKRRSIAECEKLFDHRYALGFRTVTDEAISIGAHARYCLAIGEKNRALEYAARCLRDAGTGGAANLPPEIVESLQDIVRRSTE